MVNCAFFVSGVFAFFIDSCKALLIISYVKRRYIKWKLLIIIITEMDVVVCSLGKLSAWSTWIHAVQNKSKMVEHKLTSFATIVRLCRLFQLYYYLCSGKTYQTKIMPFLPLCCDSEAVLSKNSPKLECSYCKIFISNTEISIAKSEISVTGAARLHI